MPTLECADLDRGSFDGKRVNVDATREVRDSTTVAV